MCLFSIRNARCLFGVMGLWLAPVFALSDDDSHREIVNQFIGNYCLECHDVDLQKADREFENFDLPLKSVLDLITAKDIINQVTLKEMPPKKAEQPTDRERADLIQAIRKSIASARGKIEADESNTVMRRLSNREYENTLAILFNRRVDTLGLTADFPKEKTSHHIDTIGESLITSGFLLDQYFQSAHRLVESRLGKKAMKPKDWHFTKHFIQYEELGGSHKAAFNYEYLCIYEQPNTDTRQGSYGHIEDFLEGVPVSGLYDIKVLAQAMHRDTHYDPKIFRIDLSEPFIIGVVPGDVTKGHIHYPQAIEPILAQTKVPDEKAEWLTFRVWLEAGQTPRFIFPNGPYESRASVMAINKKYKDEFKGKGSKLGVGRAHILTQGKLPHIRIGEVKIHGPITEKSGGLEEVAIFGEKGFQADQALSRLYAFGERSFRRPLNDGDRERIRETYEKRVGEKANPRKAALDTLKMILCSPSFLYFSEIIDEKKHLLSSYDLASRLSYALWASPPDQELFAVAASGNLADPNEVRKQALRLLKDNRVNGFVNGFLDSWLNLRDLGGMPPPRKPNLDYYAENLPESMKEEVRLFFRDLIEKDGSIANFLDSDYTFVDKKLAKLYQLPQQKTLRLADGFERVSIKDNPQRGGLLGMAGVLVVSANGIETSPVTRGVWVSENILGIVPPPPPDDVPSIDADVSDAKTVRERLEKHRADKVCAECHRKMDPLGFSLETFDPIGRWRTKYPKPKGKAPAPKIDSTGEFSSGETYTDFDGFKKIIVKSRKDNFARHLVSQILSYSTGRDMEPNDYYQIEDIFEATRKNNYGLRTLIVESLASEAFRSR